MRFFRVVTNRPARRRGDTVNEITVDYEQLARQITLLYTYRDIGRNELFDGVLELLHRIVEDRPFREVKDK